MAQSTDQNAQRDFTDIIFEYAQHNKKKGQWRVKFAAFVTQFQDNYSQNWNSTNVYGKPDSIETYRSTARNITLAWDVPSNGPFEGYGNMVKIDALIRMLYPVYKVRGDEEGRTDDWPKIKTIQRPPLLRLKFANFARTPANKGLLGHVQGFTFAPDFNQGMYNTRDKRQFGPNIMYAAPQGIQQMGKDFVDKMLGQDSDKVGLIPKVFKMQCQFTVLHEHDLGFDENDDFAVEKFPYGFMTKKDDGQLVQVNKFGTSPINKTNIPNPALAEIEYANILKTQQNN